MSLYGIILQNLRVSKVYQPSCQDAFVLAWPLWWLSLNPSQSAEPVTKYFSKTVSSFLILSYICINISAYYMWEEEPVTHVPMTHVPMTHEDPMQSHENME